MQSVDESLDINDFEKHEKLYEGNFVDVFDVHNKKTNIVYVAKIPRKETRFFTKDEIINYFQDIIINSKLSHPSIINFIGYSPIDFEKKEKLVVITEYAQSGLLSSITESKNQNVSDWNFTKKLINIYGIASAMAYLHSNNIIHCNLTPDSILLDQNLYPKLFCFKHSKEIKNFTTDKSEETQYNQQNSKATDIHGYALLIYEILTNKKLIALVDDDSEEIIDETIPDCYFELIANCLQDSDKRPTFDQIITLLETNPEFITNQVNIDEYKSYVKKIKEYPTTFDFTPPILNPSKYLRRIEKNERSKTIQKLLSSQKPKKLMKFLHDCCDLETTSIVFDRCFAEYPEMYQALVHQGVLMNNTVAHQKYALSLLFERNSDDLVFHKAKAHLEKSIRQGFASSYFSLALLSYEFFKKEKFAFLLAEEGAKKGEKNSMCLFGYFIAHGIGTEKDHVKGVALMLESGFDCYRDSFATDIGIYFIELLHTRDDLLGRELVGSADHEEKSAKHNGQGTEKVPAANKETGSSKLAENGTSDDPESDALCVEYEETEYEYEEDLDELSAFNWFEKAYNANKNAATITNLGLCFLHGIGVSKDEQRAKQILGENATQKTDPESLSRLHFTLDEKVVAEPQLDVNFGCDQISSQPKSPKKFLPRRISKSMRMASSTVIPRVRYFAPQACSEDRSVERARKQLDKLVHAGNCYIPIQYAFNLYKERDFKKAFYYFSVISRVNNPIATFFVGMMKYRGEGCTKNTEEAKEILKNLSNIGNDGASQFFEEIFYSG